MKNRLLLSILGLLLAFPAFSQLNLSCPTSGTFSFASSDISAGAGVLATKCQRIIPFYLDENAACNGCTSYTITFSNGNPAPAFLPANTTDQTDFFAFGKGQTIVNLTGTDGTSVSSCSFAVTLIDDEPPIIMAPPTPATVTAKSTLTLPDLRSLIQVEEDCEYTIAQAPAPGSPVSGNLVSLTFVATDGSGNNSDPFEMALSLTATTPFDAMTFSAVGGCAGSGIDVTLGGLSGASTYEVAYQIDNGALQTISPVNSSGVLTFNTSGGLAAGIHTITILSISQDSENPVFINRSASVYIGVPPVNISNLLVSNTLGNGICMVTINGIANGVSFVFTGPNGYVFSNVYRNGGTYSVVANGVVEPGQYTLTASYPANNCGTTTTTQTVNVGGVKCD